jgi:hypothetical protein
MTDLRKYAEGQACLIRVPNCCNGRTDTTVLCHLRMIGISGFGLKAPDVLGAFGCSECHDFVDGRSHPNNTTEYRRSLLLEGIARTINFLVSKGVLTW